MKVRITGNTGAFTDARGRTIAPAVGDAVEVSKSLGEALIDADNAEKISARQARSPSENTAATGPQETR